MTVAPFVIGTDTGGTFTDTVILTGDGATFMGKALTTHDALVDGVLASIGAACSAMGVDRAEVLANTTLLAHGTTVGLNALLTGKGAKVGLLTTAGFEATLPIARSNKIHGLSEDDVTDALKWRKPDLLVPRRRILGVPERIDTHGEVILALDEEAAAHAIRTLVERGAEALAVSLLWSVANPVHERRLAEIAAQEAPGMPVTLSSHVAPRIGEYERTATAVLNAFVAPLVSDYLTKVEQALQAEGFRGRFLIMTMSGGVQLAATVAQAPIHLLQSGPVGGITAARALGQRLGHSHVIATDVGGTSFDVGLVVNAELPRTQRPRIERHGLAVAVVDIASIGTGGGSIAHVDAVTGALRVGPESAGSTPGPACYGRGGDRPTVTDAAVVLGHVDRLGAAIALDRGAAREAVSTVADRLNMGIEDAAQGIVDVASAQMADLVRRATVQRGHDPRRFMLYAYGGAAPQYVGRYAADLGVAGVVIPRLGPAFSAWGAICSDLTVLRERDLIPRPFALPLDEAMAALAGLEADAAAEFDGLDGTLVIERRIGLRFSRQIHRIDVPLPIGVPDVITAAEAVFRARYERIVGRGTSGSAKGIELVSVAAEARIAAPAVVERKMAAGSRRKTHVRRAWFGGKPLDVPVYDLAKLGMGEAIAGPAFLESLQTTIVVHPGTRAEITESGDVLIAPDRNATIVQLDAKIAR
jgi:N-methylhydantoinase A